MKLSLKEHIQRSREAVSANKAKGNRHAEILTGLYTDLNRFIEEVMQNAEDAYRRKADLNNAGAIKFFLYNDRVEILHDGKDFDEDDLMSVTTFANTTKDKKNEVNLIGKFGIGFKSVFSITDRPEIHCGGYHYCIEDYEILGEVLPVVEEMGFGTRIILPFKTDNQKKIFESVRSGLMSINADYLLFLKKIRNVVIVFENGNERRIACNVGFVKDNVEIRRFLFTGQNEHRTEEYLLISDCDKDSSEISLAFKLDSSDGKQRIVPCKSSGVFVYFPTLHDTGLKFLLNARFTTTPTREFVPFDKFKSPENIKILKEAGAFYRTALVKIKEIGFFNNTFLNVLPLENPDIHLFNSRENEIYRMFYDMTLEVLKNRKIIPVNGKRFGYASEIAFTGSDAIAALLKKNDLELLFNRSEWFDNSSFVSDSSVLFDYLENKLDIKKVDEESFAFRLAVNPTIFKDKSEKWFVKLYEFLLKNRHLWDDEHRYNYYSLRHKPIILTDDGELMSAFDENDIPIVYLPSGRARQHNTVNRSLVKNEKVLLFLRELGLNEPDLYAEVMNSVIPKYMTKPEIGFAEYSKDLLKVLFVYFNDSVNRKTEMISALMNAYFIYTSSGNYEKSQSVYSRNKNLIEYFDGQENILFVSERTYRFLLNNSFDPKSIDEFFTECRVKQFPEITVNQGEVNMEGFEFILKKPSLKKTKSIIKVLLSVPKEFFTAEVISFLEKTKWIFFKTDKIYAPVDIEITKLSTRTGIDESEKIKLKTILNFRVEKYGRLNEKQHKILALFDKLGISEEEIDLYINSYSPGKTTPEIIDYSAPDIKCVDESDSIKGFEFIGGLQKIIAAGFQSDISVVNKKLVRDVLYAEFENDHDVEILDDDIPKGMSCDFLIRKNNEIIRLVYIAEKSGLGNSIEIENEKWTEIEKNAETGIASRTFIYALSSKTNKIVRFHNPSGLLSSKRLHKKSILLLFC